MKSFFNLLEQRKFSLFIIIAAAIIIWNIFHGSRIIGLFFLVLFIVAICVNLYKTL